MAKNREAVKRALQMASMTAGVTGSYLGYFAQKIFLDENARQRVLKQTHAKAGRRITTRMAKLRGPAMKLGQTLSLQAGLLPEEALAELTSLQMSAPRMHASLVLAVFRAEFSREPEQMFRQFAIEPFAAASLGQVHRAVTKNGQTVAVKVQYPAIRETIKADFRWFRTASKPAQWSKHLPPEVLDELERQFLEETDYRAEADNIALLRKKLKPLLYVEVPQIFPDYSSERVLTMSLLEGMHLDAFLATKPSQTLRDKIGERLFELYYFQVLRVEAFHADPHWGNYLFRSDGTIGLVDFGCVKRMRPEFAANLRAMYLYPGSSESAEFQRLLEQRYRMFGNQLAAPTRRALLRFVETFYRKVYPPEREKEHIAIDFADAAFIREYMRQATNLANSRGATPEYVFLSRAETGLYHTLHRLQARVHTSAIVRRWQ
jgi:predicted unusual protein kinase regulating ubiquinone biosynthesis (AarF/ABC1/UbiB family)